jgi:hypothetical protein
VSRKKGASRIGVTSASAALIENLDAAAEKKAQPILRAKLFSSRWPGRNRGRPNSFRDGSKMTVQVGPSHVRSTPDGARGSGLRIVRLGAQKATLDLEARHRAPPLRMTESLMECSKS